MKVYRTLSQEEKEAIVREFLKDAAQRGNSAMRSSTTPEQRREWARKGGKATKKKWKLKKKEKKNCA